MKKFSLPTVIVFTVVLMVLSLALGGCPGKRRGMYGGGAPSAEMQSRV